MTHIIAVNFPNLVEGKVPSRKRYKFTLDKKVRTLSFDS